MAICPVIEPSSPRSPSPFDALEVSTNGDGSPEMTNLELDGRALGFEHPSSLELPGRGVSALVTQLHRPPRRPSTSKVCGAVNSRLAHSPARFCRVPVSASATRPRPIASIHESLLTAMPCPVGQMLHPPCACPECARRDRARLRKTPRALHRLPPSARSARVARLQPPSHLRPARAETSSAALIGRPGTPSPPCRELLPLSPARPSISPFRYAARTRRRSIAPAVLEVALTSVPSVSSGPTVSTVVRTPLESDANGVAEGTSISRIRPACAVTPRASARPAVGSDAPQPSVDCASMPSADRDTALKSAREHFAKRGSNAPSLPRWAVSRRSTIAHARTQAIGESLNAPR